ncbi:hypothetical protein [Burkholderia diffusa]|uniref:hypothetical protein n=1 Tax=Burkholderia diffusa TaxID=488732 RepID=UPI000A9C9364|nr:hypothetical protein [Burkholderia diffusa]
MSAVFDTSAARDFERSPVKRVLREHAEHPPDRLGLISGVCLLEDRARKDDA